jgi:hypothetical protein
MVEPIDTSLTDFTVFGPVLDWDFAIVAVSVKAHIFEGFRTILSFRWISIYLWLILMKALWLRFLELRRISFKLIIAFELEMKTFVNGLNCKSRIGQSERRKPINDIKAEKSSNNFVIETDENEIDHNNRKSDSQEEGKDKHAH